MCVNGCGDTAVDVIVMILVLMVVQVVMVMW